MLENILVNYYALHICMCVSFVYNEWVVGNLYWGCETLNCRQTWAIDEVRLNLVGAILLHNGKKFEWNIYPYNNWYKRVFGFKAWKAL